MNIRLYENLRTLSYAPYYLAEVWQHYEAQQLEVETIPSPAPPETARGLIEGRVDVSWGGPMRVLLNHDADPDCPLVCFGQVVGGDPFMLIGREPRRNFQFKDLCGLTVGVVSEVPTPWMTMQDDLGRAGIDPVTIQRGPPRTMSENVAALAAGELDVIQVMEPQAAIALSRPDAHLWHRFSIRGEVAFTTFYAPRAFIRKNPVVCRALVAALEASIAQLYQTPAEQVATLLQPWFPDVAAARLSEAVRGYQAASLWTRDPAISPAHLARLKAALLSGGLITRDIPFEAVVDESFLAE